MGSPLAVQNHHFLLWTATMKSVGQITDQASLNYLYYWLEEDETYCVSSPHRDNLCITGEGIKEGHVPMPEFTDGKWRGPNGPYHIVHQWDRVPEIKERLLANQNDVGA